MPISSAAVSLGRSGADMLTSALELAVLIIGGLLLGWRIESVALPAIAAIGLLLWLRFALLWVGIFLGLTLRAEGATMAVQVLVWPLGFASNVFVAPETMPAWLGRSPVEPDLGHGDRRARAVRQPDGRADP